jgi:hypothetical protein
MTKFLLRLTSGMLQQPYLCNSVEVVNYDVDQGIESPSPRRMVIRID